MLRHKRKRKQPANSYIFQITSISAASLEDICEKPRYMQIINYWCALGNTGTFSWMSINYVLKANFQNHAGVHGRKESDRHREPDFAFVCGIKVSTTSQEFCLHTGVSCPPITNEQKLHTSNTVVEMLPHPGKTTVCAVYKNCWRV